MKRNLMLRYVSTAGPVRVFVNGFLLVNDLTGENSGTRLEPYVQSGQNSLKLDARGAPDSKISIQVVLVPDDGGPGETVLLQLNYPDPAVPGRAVEALFELLGSLPAATWSQLQPAPPSAESTLHPFLASLAALILHGPDDELLRLLTYKHGEVGTSLGIGKAAMDQGLTQGLAGLRATPGFRVDLAPPAALAPAWSSDRRLVRPLRNDGRDAILLSGPAGLNGFELTLGFHRGAWIVIR